VVKFITAQVAVVKMTITNIFIAEIKMSISFFNFFKNKDTKTDLEKALKLGLITYEEKLRLEADRTARRLEKYITKRDKKKKK
jgi:hypothetical protein